MTATLDEEQVAPPEIEAVAPPVPGQEKWGWALLAILPGLAVLGVGGYRIGRRQLWDNELVTWYSSTLSGTGFRRLIANIDLVQAAYYVAIREWIQHVGDSPTVLRLPSLIALALTGVLTALIGRRLFDTTVGVLGGLILAVLPVTSRYAQETRSYALVTLSAAVALWLLPQAAKGRRRLPWVLYTIALVITGWLNFVALLALAGHWFWVWRTGRHRDDRLWYWTSTVGVATLFVVPLLTYANKQKSQVRWVHNDWSSVQGLVVNLFGAWWLVALIPFSGVLAVILAGRRWRTPAVALLIGAMFPLILGYATTDWLHLFQTRYFLFTVPAYALLAALCAVRLGRLALGRFRRTGLVLGVVTGLAMVAAVGWLGLPTQRVYRADYLPGQPDYRAATSYLAAHVVPGDAVAYNDLLGGADDEARTAVRYQFRHGTAPRDVFLGQSAADRGWYTGLACVNDVACVGTTTRIWLIETGHAGNSLDGLPPNELTLLRKQFTITQTVRFTKIRVLELDHR